MKFGRKEINKLSYEDSCYVAGLFDGEGTITLTKVSRTSKGELGKSPSFVLRARIRMTDKNIIDWLRITIGGRYYFYTASKKPNQKPCHEWNVAGINAMSFLRDIYPYLKVKRLQADVAFRFGETIVTKGYHIRLSPEIMDRRQGLRAEMNILNKRGLN